MTKLDVSIHPPTITPLPTITPDPSLPSHPSLHHTLPTFTPHLPSHPSLCSPISYMITSLRHLAPPPSPTYDPCMYCSRGKTSLSIKFFSMQIAKKCLHLVKKLKSGFLGMALSSQERLISFILLSMCQTRTSCLQRCLDPYDRRIFTCRGMQGA